MTIAGTDAMARKGLLTVKNNGSWLRVNGSGLMVQGSRFKVQGSRFKVHGEWLFQP